MRQLTYGRWIEDNGEYLRDLSGRDVILAYSGGKDSSLVLHFMVRAAEEYGFGFSAHAARFPLHVLTDGERDRLAAYWSGRGVDVVWHDVPETDEELGDTLERGVSPCLVCNRAKRGVIMEHFRRTGTDLDNLVLVLSYSLWDLVSATVEHTLGSVYADPESSGAVRGKPVEERFLETAQRFYPLLRLESGLTVIRPLITYNDQEIIEAVKEYDLPLTVTPCRFREYRPKRLLADYYRKMGLSFSHERVLRFAREALKVPDLEFFQEVGTDRYMKKMV